MTDGSRRITTAECIEKGHGFLTGRDVHGDACLQDFAEARRWLELAHLKGAFTGTHLLGLMHEQGKGGPVEIEKAIELYTIAAERGSYLSCLHLARIYAARDVDPTPRATAAVWYARVLGYEGEVDADEAPVLAEARAYLRR